MLFEQTVLREGHPPPAAAAAAPSVPSQPRANASNTAAAKVRSPPAPSLSRADVTQLPSTSLENAIAATAAATLTGSRVGAPSRRHQTCEDGTSVGRRGLGGASGVAGRNAQRGSVVDFSHSLRRLLILCPRATHLSFTNTHATFTGTVQSILSSRLTPFSPPFYKKRETLSPLSPEMTPPAGLWNILILFPNSYYVWSV